VTKLHLPKIKMIVLHPILKIFCLKMTIVLGIRNFLKILPISAIMMITMDHLLNILQTTTRLLMGKKKKKKKKRIFLTFCPMMIIEGTVAAAATTKTTTEIQVDPTLYLPRRAMSNKLHQSVVNFLEKIDISHRDNPRIVYSIFPFQKVHG